MGIWSTIKAAVALNAIVAQCAAIPSYNAEQIEQIKKATDLIFKRQAPIDEYSFRFETLTPSTTLQWVDCYGSFKCARLKVPLDYHDASKGFAAVAVMKLPADPSVPYKGTVFSHPGGAGNPSVPYFLSLGQIFQSYIIGTGYDFVTWDARGAGQTTPTLTCFANQDERYAFEQRGRRLPPLSKSTWSTYQQYYRDYNAKCQARSGNFIPHLGFIQTTRDMVSIADAMGIQKINIWGFSYGANIGALLVALYPSRLGKTVLDSVSKIHERWLPGTSVEFELKDHKKMVEYYFRACHSTGSTDGCAFYSPTVAQMYTRYNALVAGITAKPISMTGPDGTVGNYTVENFKADVFACMPGLAGPPAQLWPVLAYLLIEVEGVLAGGQPNLALSYFYNGGLAPRSVSPPVSGRQQGPTDAQLGIPCTDSGPLGTISQKQFESDLTKYNRIDPYFGTLFLQNYLVCSEWTGVNVEPLDFAALDQKNSETVHFISYNIDPLAPVEGAKSMFRKFRNSRVTIIDAVGHTLILGPNSMQAYGQVISVFNEPGFVAKRDLVYPANADAYGFGYSGTTFFDL